MRLWSIHPAHLDARGLVALWREGLLARAVLRGRTRGYRQHPQLARFRHCARPIASINSYLAAVHADAMRRGFRFDVSLIGSARCDTPITVEQGQVNYEWHHLLAKFRVRSPELLEPAHAIIHPSVHPLFRIVPGAIAEWERP